MEMLWFIIAQFIYVNCINTPIDFDSFYTNSTGDIQYTRASKNNIHISVNYKNLVFDDKPKYIKEFLFKDMAMFFKGSMSPIILNNEYFVFSHPSDTLKTLYGYNCLDKTIFGIMGDVSNNIVTKQLNSLELIF